jgi:hypothetical protein
MSRKKQQTADQAPETVSATVAVSRADESPREIVAEQRADEPTRPATDAEAPAEGTHGKNWGPPYKAIVSFPDKGFEMGENRRFKQRVFKFHEKPDEQVLAALKDAGFKYRAKEKAWTIQANADTRKLSEDLARQFAELAEGQPLFGQGEGVGR